MNRKQVQEMLDGFPEDAEIVIAVGIRWTGKHTGFYRILPESDYVCFSTLPGNGMAGVIWADINILGNGLVGSNEDVVVEDWPL